MLSRLCRRHLHVPLHSGWTRGVYGARAITSGTEFQAEMLTGEHAGVAVLSLSRPAVKNALGKAMIEEMRAVVQSVAEDPEVRAVVLRSTVPGVFCAGADLKERKAMAPEEVPGFVKKLRMTFDAVARLPQPVIAAIEGAAMGGGAELALAADMRVLGQGAVFALPETALAIIPGAGGTQRLPRLIGAAKAKYLIFTGQRLSAQEATEYGISQQCVPAGDAESAALDIARRIARNGPVAVRAAKAAINAGIEVSMEHGLSIEEACYSSILGTSDRLEGLAAFAEKRKPQYQGK